MLRNNADAHISSLGYLWLNLLKVRKRNWRRWLTAGDQAMQVRTK